MTRRARSPWWLAPALLASCVGTGTNGRSVSSVLSETAQASVARPAAGREDPWTRLAEFERVYRAGRPDEPYYPYAAQSQYPGAAQLLYPLTVRLGAAHEYLAAGHDFEAQSDPGAAARAYWASIQLVKRSVASRPDRERVRMEAFRALAALARQRGRAQWAGSLELCAELAATYLASPQSRKDVDAFNAQYRTIVRQQEQAEDARARAERMAVFTALVSGLQQGARYAAAGNNPGAQMQATIANLQETAQIGARLGAQERAMNAALSGNTEVYGRFKSVIADDVSEIEAGHSFLAHEAIFFLATAAEHEPYLSVLERFGEGVPAIRPIVAGLRKDWSDAGLLALGAELQAHEAFLARYDRRGLRPRAER